MSTYNNTDPSCAHLSPTTSSARYIAALTSLIELRKKAAAAASAEKRAKQSLVDNAAAITACDAAARRAVSVGDTSEAQRLMAQKMKLEHDRAKLERAHEAARVTAERLNDECDDMAEEIELRRQEMS